jgi:hypothetical protein
MCYAIISALVGVCFFAAGVAVLSVPWMIGSAERD